MPFDPLTLLTLKFRGRSVAVPRVRCADYDVRHSVPSAFDFRNVLSSDCTVAKQGIIAVARSMKFMEPFAQEDLVVLAPIPDYPDQKEVEVSKEAWPLVCAVVQSVTIALESGASPMASRLFPNRRPHGAIEPVLLFFFFQ